MIIVNNRDKVEWEKGLTITGLLEKMEYDYACITVSINDELIPTEDYSTYEIEDETHVSVFHLAHGG